MVQDVTIHSDIDRTRAHLEQYNRLTTETIQGMTSAASTLVHSMNYTEASLRYITIGMRGGIIPKEQILFRDPNIIIL